VNGTRLRGVGSGCDLCCRDQRRRFGMNMVTAPMQAPSGAPRGIASRNGKSPHKLLSGQSQKHPTKVPMKANAGAPTAAPITIRGNSPSAFRSGPSPSGLLVIVRPLESHAFYSTADSCITGWEWGHILDESWRLAREFRCPATLALRATRTKKPDKPKQTRSKGSRRREAGATR
jgi:hypothetical protein